MNQRLTTWSLKIPRFTFEKFVGCDPTLTTHMKSVGEAMALGGTFKEALHKAIRSLEIDRFGLISLHGLDGTYASTPSDPELCDRIKTLLQTPTSDRLWQIADGLRAGISLDELYGLTHVDPWFLEQIRQLVEFEWSLTSKVRSIATSSSPEPSSHPPEIPPDLLRAAKELGFSDNRIAQLLSVNAQVIHAQRKDLPGDHMVTYRRVDTCGAEFEAHTPYLYSTYGQACEARPTNRKKVMILGGGPNRIGQGIEFDYCCVHAAMALREEGIETIMVNCNPETVSTDYDISDRLYFEPLTQEDVCHIIEKENPFGVVVQFGGQTPLKLALPLAS